jgi:DNA repair protein RadC
VVGHFAMTQKREKSMTMTKREEATIKRAIKILANQYQRENLHAVEPRLVRQYCQLTIGLREHEIFAILMLDNKHYLIRMVEMFRGTIDNASVYPREIVKECLALNAACVILVHNHPSGDVEPSAADRAITAKIKAALALVDIRVLDHIIVSGKDSFSFAEAGLL